MSTLIVHKQTRRKQVLGLLQFLLATVSIFFIWFPIFILLADPSILGPMIRIAFFASGLLSVVGLLASYKIARNMWRDADRLTRDMLGAKRYLDILSKLETVVQSDGGLTPRVLHLFESNPTIEERTRDLALHPSSRYVSSAT